MFHWVRLRIFFCVAGSDLIEGGPKDETSRKKKQLNEAEIALRREKTACKRKYLSEKKLEDEKMRPFPPFPLSYIDHGHPSLMRALFLYTRRRRINRLLKKKSGTRNRRNPLASAEDRTPAAHTGNGTPAEGEVDEEENGENAAAAAVAAAGTAAQVVEVTPTRYHWISTTETPLRRAAAPPGDKMFLSFSVPVSLLPNQSAAPDADAGGDVKMETTKEQEQERKTRAMVPAVCEAEGCTAKRKYRLVRDWERGACGMDHLNILERQSGPVAV
jgi:Ino eighty subunit 2